RLLPSSLHVPSPTHLYTLSLHDALPISPLPNSLPQALETFRSSELARRWFGDEFCNQYLAFREWEVEKHRRAVTDWERRRYFEIDRKSTRLNSSHGSISYAVFCLKKKKT